MLVRKKKDIKGREASHQECCIFNGRALVPKVLVRVRYGTRY